MILRYFKFSKNRNSRAAEQYFAFHELQSNQSPKLKNTKTSKDKTIIFSPPTKALYFIFKKIWLLKQ